MAASAYRAAQWLCWAAAGLLAFLAVGVALTEDRFGTLGQMLFLASLLIGFGNYCQRQSLRAGRSRLSTAPPTPPSRLAPAPPVSNPARGAVLTLTAIAGGTVALGALAAAALPGEVGTALLGVALLAAAVLALVMAVAHFAGRAQVRMIQTLLAGDHWARWEYDADLWRRFATAGWAEHRRKGLGPPGVVAGLAMALALVVAFVAHDIWVPALVLAGTLMVALVIWLPGWISARRSFAGEFRQVLIGLAGAYLIPAAGAGRLHQWHGLGMELETVRLLPGPPAVLEFAVSAAGTSRSEIQLPVPDGCDQEAAALAHRFREELGARHPPSIETGA